MGAQIGTVQRVLHGMLPGIGRAQLTHELLVTLMAEVTRIVNRRPISAVHSDINEPQPLTSTIILGTKKMTTTRIYIIYIKNHLYCLPEQAKPHQGGGKTEAAAP